MFSGIKAHHLWGGKVQNSLFRSILGEYSNGKKNTENTIRVHKIIFGMIKKNLPRNLHNACTSVAPSSEAADVCPR